MNRRTRQMLAANNELEKELTPENGRAMTDIIVYLRASNTTEYQQELVRRDITEMVLEGQRRGQTMEEVIGEDYKAFCDAVLLELPKRTAGQRVWSAVGSACLYVDVLAVIWLAFGALGWLLGEGAYPWLSVTAGNLVALVTILGVSIGLVEYICKNSFDEGVRKNKAVPVLLALLAAALAAGSVLLRGVVVFRLHIFLAVGLIAALYVVHRALEERLD